MDDSWVALRCGSKKTLKLVTALAVAGVQGWTPLWERTRREPRGNKRMPWFIPALPSFVFLPNAMINAAWAIRMRGACPMFSQMVVAGKVVRFSACELDHMRKISSKEIVAQSALPVQGAKVQINAGSFAGMRGTVLSNTKRESWLDLEGFDMPVRFPPFLFDVLGE